MGGSAVVGVLGGRSGPRARPPPRPAALACRRPGRRMLPRPSAAAGIRSCRDGWLLAGRASSRAAQQHSRFHGMELAWLRRVGSYCLPWPAATKCLIRYARLWCPRLMMLAAGQPRAGRACGQLACFAHWLGTCTGPRTRTPLCACATHEHHHASGLARTLCIMRKPRRIGKQAHGRQLAAARARLCRRAARGMHRPARLCSPLALVVTLTLVQLCTN